MRSWLAQGLIVAALALVLGWPAVATVAASVRGGEGSGAGPAGAFGPVAAEAGRVARPLQLGATSLELVLLTEAIALPLGLPLALVLFRTDAWGRRSLLGLFALSALVPMPLYATAWLGGFGNAGRIQALGARPLLVGLPGAAFVHAMAALPWIVLLAGVGFRTVEPELEESALLDLPAWRVLARVTLRRSLGALAGAALAVAVLTAGDMTVTDLLQVRTYAEEAYLQFRIGQGPAASSAVALPPLAVLGVLIVLASRGLLRADPARLASMAEKGKLWRLGRWRIPLGLLAWTSAGVIVLLPLTALVWRAGRVGGAAALGQPPHWSPSGLAGTLRLALLDVLGTFVRGPLKAALQSGTWSALREPGAWFGDPLSSPLLASVVWSTLAATMTVALGWSLAWLSRGPGPWRWASAGCVALALATPGPVAGMALVRAYNAIPIVYDTPVIIVLALVLRTLPYALLVLWPSVRACPPDLLDAAALDGYGPAGQIWRVALPSTRGAVVAAWGVGFVLAVGELPASNLVAPPGTMPMAVDIWSLMHTGVESHLAGVALVMLAAIAGFAAVAVRALGRIDRSS